jgi:hypothetical protein
LACFLSLFYFVLPPPFLASSHGTLTKVLTQILASGSVLGESTLRQPQLCHLHREYLGQPWLWQCCSDHRALSTHEAVAESPEGSRLQQNCWCSWGRGPASPLFLNFGSPWTAFCEYCTHGGGVKAVACIIIPSALALWSCPQVRALLLQTLG